MTSRLNFQVLLYVFRPQTQKNKYYAKGCSYLKNILYALNSSQHRKYKG